MKQNILKKIGFVFMITSLWGILACTSNKPILEHSPKEYPLSHGRYTVKRGDVFKSPFGGKVIDPVPGPSPFNNVVGVETKKTYYYKEHKYTSSFEVLYTNVELTRDFSSKIQTGEPLGSATSDGIYVILRSKIFDPYLVSMAQVMPYRYHEYWYFYPGMLGESAMHWLSYAPFGKFQAEWRYRQTSKMVQDGENFENKTLVRTSLAEYPITSSDGGSSQSLSYENITFNLKWPKDYDKLLETEYKLGEPIYLYLSVTDVDGHVFSCNVDEYSLISPDEIVDGYMADIQSRM